MNSHMKRKNRITHSPVLLGQRTLNWKFTGGPHLIIKTFSPYASLPHVLDSFLYRTEIIPWHLPLKIQIFTTEKYLLILPAPWLSKANIKCNFSNSNYFLHTTLEVSLKVVNWEQCNCICLIKSTLSLSTAN